MEQVTGKAVNIQLTSFANPIVGENAKTTKIMRINFLIFAFSFSEFFCGFLELRETGARIGNQQIS